MLVKNPGGGNAQPHSRVEFFTEMGKIPAKRRRPANSGFARPVIQSQNDFVKCGVCLAQIESEQDELCDRCRSLAAIARERLEAARRSKRKPPRKMGPPCQQCGSSMKPVLFRPDGPWTWYCAKGCYGGAGCLGVFRYDQVCPCWHCPRCKRIDPRGRSVRPIPNGKPCPNCGGRQSAMSLH